MRMRSMIGGLAVAAVLACAGGAVADTSVMSMLVTNGGAAVTSEQFTASGWLDKIELTTGTTGTPTQGVVVATYTGTTAVETMATVALLTSTKVVRLRTLPTDNTGTALAAALVAVTAASSNTAAGTVLNVPYCAPLVGGNMKMVVTPQAGSLAGTNTVTCTVYYQPLKQ